MRYTFFLILLSILIFYPLVSQGAVTLYDFEDGSVQGWVNDTTEYFSDNLGVPSATMLQAQEGVYSLSYPLNLDVKDPVYDCINDVGCVTLSSPKNLAGSEGISTYVYILDMAQIDNNTPACATVYVKTGSQWKWFESNDYTNISLGSWTKVEIDFSLSQDESGNPNQQVTNLDEVHEIGIHLSGAEISSGQTIFYVDTVECQGAWTMTDVTVTVEGVWVAIELTGSINFGVRGLGEEVVSDTSLTIKNIGTIPLTLSLSLIDPSGWTSVQTDPGDNTYVLNGMFNDNAPLGADFSEIQHALGVTPRKSSSIIFAGNQTGVYILPGESRSLWLEFRAPITTEITTEQTIKMIVSIEMAGETVLGISIDSRNYNFGPLATRSTAVSTIPVVVTNTGNVLQTYWLQLAEPEDWTHSTVASGNNIYVLNTAFDSDGEVDWDNSEHALDTSLAPCSQTKFAGDSSGVFVPTGEGRNLWFQIKMPTNIIGANPQNIRVIFVASES